MYKENFQNLILNLFKKKLKIIVTRTEINHRLINNDLDDICTDKVTTDKYFGSKYIRLFKT